MKSLGFLSPLEAFSVDLAAFCSCGCRKVRALKVVWLEESGVSPQHEEYLDRYIQGYNLAWLHSIQEADHVQKGRLLQSYALHIRSRHLPRP